MIEIEINKKNLITFLDNIRDLDNQELKYFLGKNYRKKFIDIVLKSKRYTHFLSYNSIPSCIGGIYPDKFSAQVWLLCSNNYNKRFLYKYIKNKFSEYLNLNFFFYNYIYKTNFSAIRWLSRLGFDFIDLKNPDIKFFYFKGGNIDLRRIADQFISGK